ncbi:TPA: coat protein [Clostridioides difficile]|uniref:major capsid protein n=1 Tax=Clostridioides difficile TaxID=1496 RepID=UPI00038D0080|nr:major capsid protein [Clostridioides difficile]EIS9330744.1 coat protein [Clostridioides difficile]EIS9396419.1 coat protein [Clostridioides difficile]EIS9561451.1 coat protein [Clostridioides difficile]EIS9661132.1 coat protein [Clostridioides difficile]EIS9705505.1 coat protein [Clostridioides difficile]
MNKNKSLKMNIQLLAGNEGGTKLSDIIVPSLFNPYVINRTMEKSALLQSGIITNNSEFDKLASQASPLVNMPFFEDLTGESEQIIEDVDLQNNKITSNADVAVIMRRAKMWSATDLSAALAGKDPAGAIAELVSGFWARDMQKELIAILKGVFGTTKAVGETVAETRLASNILDISSSSGNAAKWSGSAFIDAQQKLGDAKETLTAVAVHSAVEAELRKQNLIETVQPSNSGPIYFYQNKRVIIDDGCPYEGSGSNIVFTSYLFGEGAIALGNGNPVGFVATEIDRDKKKGSGVDYIINRKTFIMHPRGVKFTNENMAKTEGPSRAELSDATNWKPVYEPKQIRMVAFRHKI